MFLFFEKEAQYMWTIIFLFKCKTFFPLDAGDGTFSLNERGFGTY